MTTKTKRLIILESSLEKKKKQFSEKLQNHFETVKKANGQPLNDKRNGQATLNEWDKQNNHLRNLDESINKTERAIEIEKGKILDCESVKNILPKEIFEMIENGTLTQWRKHPNTFFVKGVDKARICWDNKKKIVSHKYLNKITDKYQFKLFAKTYNNLFKSINNK